MKNELHILHTRFVKRANPLAPKLRQSFGAKGFGRLGREGLCPETGDDKMPPNYTHYTQKLKNWLFFKDILRKLFHNRYFGRMSGVRACSNGRHVATLALFEGIKKDLCGGISLLWYTVIVQ